MDIAAFENKIIHADCMDILRALPDKCVDLVLTDPPYGSGGDASFSGKDGRFGGLFDKCRKPERTGGTWASKYERKISDWDVAPTEEMFRELFRVSKNQIIWGGNYFNLPPTRCFNIWRKLTISEDFTMAMCEYAWTSFAANAKLWEFAPQDKSRFHPTQKPVGLIMRQIEEYTEQDAILLDPSSGSGTTAIAAHRLGRRFICIEKDSEYHAASVKRLDDERRQGRLDLFPPVAKGNQSHLWTTNGN